MRLRWAAIATAAAIVLAACSATDNGGVVGGAPQRRAPLAAAGALRSLLPAAIAGRGVLRVVGAVGRAPLLFDGTGTTQPAGIEWELLQAIGRQLGLTVTVSDAALSQLGPDVVAGKADVLMSAFVDLKVFEANGIDFVDYLTGSTGVLVTRANPHNVSGAADLCGRTVGVMAGTAQQLAVVRLDATCKAAHRPPLTVLGVTDHAMLTGVLNSGRVEADLDDEVVAEYTAQESTGPTTMEVVGTPVDPVPYGIGIDHGDTQLVTAIQSALRAVIADGEYDQVLARWGGGVEALRTAVINGGQ